MADNQPDPNAAPNGTDPQNQPSGPTGAPAEQSPTAPVALSEDQLTYLKGQGLTDEDLKGPDAISKIIAHAQTSQKTATGLKTRLDNISKTINPGPSGPVNPLQPSAAEQPIQEQPTGAPQQPAQQGLDQVAAYNLAANLSMQFPTLKEDLMSGKLYQDMQEFGIPLISGGTVNMQGLLKYAETRHNQNVVSAELEELKNKPGAIPDAKPGEGGGSGVADDAPMTKQMAQAILFQDPNHARADEAKRFLQTGK